MLAAVRVCPEVTRPEHSQSVGDIGPGAARPLYLLNWKQFSEDDGIAYTIRRLTLGVYQIRSSRL